MSQYFISIPFCNYINLKDINSIKGSFTLYPRKGLLTNIILSLRYNFAKQGWVNKIGLRNKGIDYAIEKYKNTNYIISIAIIKEEEIAIFKQKIPTNMNLELNISCPNVEKSLVNQQLKTFLNPERQWCIIKVSPLTDMNLIDKYYQEGFRQFHCSNTLPCKEGGLSGKTLMKYNKILIPQIKNKYKDIIIIGGRGIQTYQDIFFYRNLGADHFSFSPFRAYKLVKSLSYY